MVKEGGVRVGDDVRVGKERKGNILIPPIANFSKFVHFCEMWRSDTSVRA